MQLQLGAERPGYAIGTFNKMFMLYSQTNKQTNTENLNNNSKHFVERRQFEMVKKQSNSHNRRKKDEKSAQIVNL